MNHSAIKTLEQVRFEAARKAVAENDTVAAAAYDLCITRYELTAILKRQGAPKRRNHKPGNVILLARAAAVLLLVALTGCATTAPQPLARVAPIPPPLPPVQTTISARSVVGPPAVLRPITIEWDAPFQDARLNAMLRYAFYVRSEVGSGNWQFYTNVVGTNRLTVANRAGQEFFTIGKLQYVTRTNVWLGQPGF